MSTNIPKFGILTGSHVHYIDSHTMQYVQLPVNTLQLQHVGQVMTLASHLKLDTIWVHLSNAEYESLPDDFIQKAVDAGFNLGSDPKYYDFTTMGYFSGWDTRKEVYAPRIGVGFTNYQFSNWCIDEDVTPKDVYTAFYYLEKALGTRMHHTPANVGQSLIRYTNTGKRAGYLIPTTRDMTDFRVNKAGGSVWHRPLTKDERSKKWLHHVDRNAAYLNSCSIQFGYGDYEIVEKPHFIPTIPGLWDVTIHGTSLYEGVYMPYATPLLETPERRGYLYTSTVKLLLDAGYTLTFHRGLLWPIQRANILGPFQTLMSDAYVGIRTDVAKYPNAIARAIAKEVIKNTYTMGLSNLAHEEVFIDSTYINRQDWYHMILADASQRIIRNIMTYHTMGVDPVITLTDGLYYPSDEQDISKALPNLRMEGKVGHFKHVWSLPLAEAVKVLDSDLPTNLVIAELKKRVREYQHA